MSGSSGKTMRRDSGNAKRKKREQPAARLVRTGEASCSTQVGAKRAKSAKAKGKTRASATGVSHAGQVSHARDPGTDGVVGMLPRPRATARGMPVT